jgi:hypothetical protein
VRLDAQQAAAQLFEIVNRCGRADRRRAGRPDLRAFDDHGHAERRVRAHASADHVYVSRLEDAQA